jgi:hypothetical protein
LLKYIDLKGVTKIAGAIIAVLTAILQVPVVRDGVLAFFTAHPTVSSLLGGLTAILTLLHVPTGPTGTSDQAQ